MEFWSKILVSLLKYLLSSHPEWMVLDKKECSIKFASLFLNTLKCCCSPLAERITISNAIDLLIGRKFNSASRNYFSHFSSWSTCDSKNTCDLTWGHLIRQPSETNLLRGYLLKKIKQKIKIFLMFITLAYLGFFLSFQILLGLWKQKYFTAV